MREEKIEKKKGNRKNFWICKWLIQKGKEGIKKNKKKVVDFWEEMSYYRAIPSEEQKV